MNRTEIKKIAEAVADSVQVLIDRGEVSADRIGNLERSLIKSASHAKEMESNWRGARVENTLSLAQIEELERKIEELESAIYDLQMSDSHLEFISRVQDAGMHHDWDEFMDTLIHAEKHLNKAGSGPKDYESVELDFEPDEPSEFGIFYKGRQVSMYEIVLRLNRLSELEKQNDAISALVLNWTEKVIELSEHVDKNESWDNGYCQGKLEGVEMCRDGISDIWKEGWKK